MVVLTILVTNQIFYFVLSQLSVNHCRSIAIFVLQGYIFLYLFCFFLIFLHQLNHYRHVCFKAMYFGLFCLKSNLLI